MHPFGRVAPQLLAALLLTCTAAQADDKADERAARALYVEAAKVLIDTECTEGHSSPIALSIWISFSDQIKAALADDENCRAGFMRAAQLHRRILDEFPSTEVAYTLARDNPLTATMIDRAIATVRADREAAELRRATKEKDERESVEKLQRLGVIAESSRNRTLSGQPPPFGPFNICVN
jgi:hypothetical protein